MKCTARPGCVDWMRQQLPPGVGFGSSSFLPDLPSIGYRAVRLPFPKDSGSKVFLAKCLAECCGQPPSLLVYPTNVHIWPSSGHLPVLSRLRQAWGEPRSIDEYPGHVFASDERD